MKKKIVLVIGLLSLGGSITVQAAPLTEVTITAPQKADGVIKTGAFTGVFNCPTIAPVYFQWGIEKDKEFTYQIGAGTEFKENLQLTGYKGVKDEVHIPGSSKAQALFSISSDSMEAFFGNKQVLASTLLDTSANIDEFKVEYTLKEGKKASIIYRMKDANTFQSNILSPATAISATCTWYTNGVMVGTKTTKLDYKLQDGFVKGYDGWYFYKNKEAVKDAWCQKEGNWYYMNATGSSVYDTWNKIQNNWYYFNPACEMLTGWQQIQNDWYYLGGNNDGAMKTDWQLQNGTWYYLGKDGAMKTGWQFVNNSWYYIEESGAMASGWVKVHGNWYYLNNSGAMETGWKLVNGSWYYLEGNGVMKTSGIVDGWSIGGNGVASPL